MLNLKWEQNVIVYSRGVQLQARGPILVRKVFFWPAMNCGWFARLGFRSENIYSVVVFIFFDCVHVLLFKLNPEQPVPLRFTIYVVFYSSNCNGLRFSLWQLQESKGCITCVGRNEDEPGPTGEVMKHSTSTRLLKTLSCIESFTIYWEWYTVLTQKSILRKGRRRRLAGHLFQDRWKDQGRGFILLPPWPPNCLGQMLTVRDFSQHLVSSSKTIRPNIPRGARCMGHCEMMWSAVCSLAPHSQFARGARPHLYMDEQKRPTPERRRLSLTQAALGRPIPKGLELALGMKAWSDNALAEYSMSHFVFVHSAARTSISERLSSNFRAAGTNERLDFNLSLHSTYVLWLMKLAM